MNNQPSSANLDNPLYYLENALTLVRWVYSLHADLLNEDEKKQIDAFLNASTEAQALLIRMIMRRQTIFRLDQLSHYAEIKTDLYELIDQLSLINLITPEPCVSLANCLNLLNKDELWLVQNLHTELRLKKSALKKELITALKTLKLEPRSLSSWLNEDIPSIEINCQGLFERLRLMFFGNLRQSWSEFVVTELGYFNYEPVSLDQNNRAFRQRDDVDHYLALDHILDDNNPDTLNDRAEAAIAINPKSDWLKGRRARVLYMLGRALERESHVQQALDLYRRSGLNDANIRELRVLEKHNLYEEAWQRVNDFKQSPHTPLVGLAYDRVMKRTGKKTGNHFKATSLETPEQTKQVIVKKEGMSVERCVVESLSSKETPYFYVENCLINGLFGLLFWEALYAPVEGAFFHPFQSQPADLYRRGFKTKRTALIEQAFKRLSNEQYKSYILETYNTKKSVTNSFIHWGVLSAELLDMALNIIPAEHLKLIFERLLIDIRTHRSGFPDLICFNTQSKTYQLIEVKGPGDRLQDNQRLWLDYFVKHNIPSSVCWVTWSNPS